MAQFASDTFTGADGTELTTYNAAWVNRTRSGAENFVLSNANRVRGPSNACEYYHTGTPASADYSVECDIYVASSVGGTSAGPFGRATTTYSNCYSANLHVGSGWRLYKQVGGGFTLLQAVAFTPIAGTTYRLKLEMIGTAIKVYVDGVLTINVTDSAVTAAGKAGIRFHNLATSVSNSVGFHIDNFSADDYAPGSTPFAVSSSTQVNTSSNVSLPTPPTPFTSDGSTGSGTSTGGSVTVTAIFTVAPSNQVNTSSSPTLPGAAAAFGYVNVAGSWKSVSAAYVNVGGVWKSVSAIKVNVSGSWKSLV